MSASIIPFPRKPAQNAVELEKIMRRWLAELSTDPDLIETVVTRMLTFIEQYASKPFEPVFDLPVPRDLSQEETEALLEAIEKGTDAMARQVQQMINEIIIERFFLEVEIYKTRNSVVTRSYLK